MAPSCCIICKQNIKPKTDPGYKCVAPCKKSVHISCVKIPPNQIKNISNGSFLWQCCDCVKSKRRSSIISDEPQPSISTSETIADSQLLQIRELKATVDNLKLIVESMKKDFADLSQSMQFQSNEVDELKTKVTSFDVLHGKADVNEKQCKKFSDNINELSERLDVNESNQHRNEVEISGVPDDVNECLPDVLNSIGDSLKINNLCSSIINAHRIGSLSKAAGNGRRKSTRSILVKFGSVKNRDEFVSRGRAFMKHQTKPSSSSTGQNPSTFSFQHNHFRCFFNDYLSSSKKLLLNQCKEYGRCTGIKLFYSRNNQIFAKRNLDSTPVKIRNLDDLKNV